MNISKLTEHLIKDNRSAAQVTGWLYCIFAAVWAKTPNPCACTRTIENNLESSILWSRNSPKYLDALTQLVVGLSTVFKNHFSRRGTGFIGVARNQSTECIQEAIVQPLVPIIHKAQQIELHHSLPHALQFVRGVVVHQRSIVAHAFWRDACLFNNPSRNIK